MFVPFLLTFREVLEAALIVVTIGGILRRLQAHDRLRVVWMATIAASLASIALVVVSAGIGYEMSTWYHGRTEEMIEGILMIAAALCITWAVCVINRNFIQYKIRLHAQIDSKVKASDHVGLFMLVFTTVFREGFEIVLFLTTIAFTTSTSQVLSGFGLGLGAGLLFALGIFRATISMPIRLVFRVTSGLLILFAAGLLVRGVHEFAEAGLIPQARIFIISFIPDASTFVGGVVKSLFGITRTMDLVQLNLYLLYTLWMSWWVYLRKSPRFARITA